jgi:hypothetical protein
VELRFGEAPGEQVEEGRGDGAHEEAVGERLVDLDAEEFFGALGHGGLNWFGFKEEEGTYHEHVLHACS